MSRTLKSLGEPSGNHPSDIKDRIQAVLKKLHGSSEVVRQNTTRYRKAAERYSAQIQAGVSDPEIQRKAIETVGAGVEVCRF